MFVSGFLAIAFIIFTHVTIYNGWRHCYFSYPCIVYFAVFSVYKINIKNVFIIKAICRAVIALSFIFNVIWIVRNHPFEYVYFAPYIRNSANQFSGDYWSISSRALLEYITKNDSAKRLKINHAYSQAGSINRGLLPESVRKRLKLTYDETTDVDYYIICRDDIPDVNIGPDGYTKVYSIVVDQDEIGAVFKKNVND